MRTSGNPDSTKFGVYEVRCIGAYPGRLVMAEALDGGERGTCGAHVDYHGLYVAIKVKNVSTP